MATRDWDAIKTEYVTGEISLRDLADKHGLGESYIMEKSAAEHWTDERERHSKTVASETETIIKSKKVRREVSARLLLFDVIDEAVAAWRKKPRATTHDLAELLKLGLAAQGETTDRTVATVIEGSTDDNAILERINQIFDGARARGDTPVSPEESEEYSTGWTDRV
jgi:hypothetical protein